MTNDVPPQRFRVSGARGARVFAQPNVSAIVVDTLLRGCQVAGVVVEGALYRGVSHWLKLDDDTGYMWRGSLSEVPL